jgi:hypothetical protein
VDFGIGIASGVEGWKVAVRVEALGFTHAWFYDTQMLCADVFVSMALAAVRTSRIKLATGVLVPTNRIAPAAANGFATLRKLAPGRIVFDVGTGFTARNTRWDRRRCAWPTSASTSGWSRGSWPARPSNGWRRAPRARWELLATGSVSDVTFQRVKDAFGERSVVDLVGAVGYYSWCR